MREKVRGGATADEGFVDRGSVPQEKDAEAGKTTGSAAHGCASDPRRAADPGTGKGNP
jgi:hypothetical protein